MEKVPQPRNVYPVAVGISKLYNENTTLGEPDGGQGTPENHDSLFSASPLVSVHVCREFQFPGIAEKPTRINPEVITEHVQSDARDLDTLSDQQCLPAAWGRLRDEREGDPGVVNTM